MQNLCVQRQEGDFLTDVGEALEKVALIIQPGELQPGELQPGELQPGELQPGELQPLQDHGMEAIMPAFMASIDLVSSGF